MEKSLRIALATRTQHHEVNALNESQIAAAGEALLSARATHTPLEVGKHPSMPSKPDDAYAIQAFVAAATGALGGWKIGAPSPAAQATFAPIAGACVRTSGVALHDGGRRLRGIEVEVAYRLANDLLPRSTPYEAHEVARAVDAMLPVIEVVETRLTDRQAADGLWALADNLSHGELVLGEPVSAWQDLPSAEFAVLLRFDDNIIVDRACHNAGGQPFDLVVRLANLCGNHCGGLRAGQIVTTGSLMGLEFAPPGAMVSATIGGIGAVEVKFS
jgi:2-keto-4-pentenoate hydratase